MSENENPVIRQRDAELRNAAARVVQQRMRDGIGGMTGPLEGVIINTEPDRLQDSLAEFLSYTGYDLVDSFEDANYRTCVMKCRGSADILLRCRLNGHKEFELLNLFPKAAHLPATRLETLFFPVQNLDEYMAMQKVRGRRFLTSDIAIAEHFLFIQTEPSAFTGSAYGFIQWTGERGNYRTRDSKPLNWTFPKPDRPYLRNIGFFDHAATRVRAQHRDPAILEFMDWTDYRFDFAVYVENLNSITNVARMPGEEFALVFTSGIKPGGRQTPPGPTEQFVENYGPRVHHLAFRTENIDDTYQALRDDGLAFLSDLVGGPDEGLKQVFTQSSSHTLLVIEYIHRYGDFDGFFTRSNVAQLTEATAKQ